MARKIALPPPPDADENVRTWVRLLMARDDLTGRELAPLVGMNRQPFYDRLNGTTPFTVKEVAALGRIFGMEPGAFYLAPVLSGNPGLSNDRRQYAYSAGDAA
jgi:hypothetical protein